MTTDRHFDPSAGGLLSALILLAGIPGSVLGGHLADRSTNLRMFVVGPLVAVAALLALHPGGPDEALRPLGIGIGFFLIFGFAAWLAVPQGQQHPSLPSTLARRRVRCSRSLRSAASSFPIIFGHLVPHTSFNTGWIFLAIVSVVFALVGLGGRTLKRPLGGTE